VGVLSSLPSWAQWTVFGGLVLGGAFGIFFALFVTWPFIRLSNRVMRSGLEVNSELLAFFKKAKVSMTPAEAKEIIEGLKKIARTGGTGGLVDKL